MQRRLTLPALLLLATALAGCFVWDPWVPKDTLPDPAAIAPSRAVDLVPPAAFGGDLDCKGGRCQQWFRVDVPQGGRLRLEARVEGLAEKAVARLFLQGVDGKVLGRAVSGEGLPLRVDTALEAGPYAVLLQVGGGPVRYELRAEVDGAL